MKKIIGCSIVAIVLLSGCGEKEESKAVIEPKKDIATTMKEKASSAMDMVKETTKDVVASSKKVASVVQEKTKGVLESSKEVAAVVQKKTASAYESSKEVSTQVVSKASDMASDVKKNIDSKMDDIMKAKEGSSVDASSLYIKCAGCHGQNGEKKALGKSAVVQGWSNTKVEEALKGYKAGTYGGTMKGIMAGQVSTLSDDDIKALAEHISKF